MLAVGLLFVLAGVLLLAVAFGLPWLKQRHAIRPEIAMLIDLIEIDRDWKKGRHTWYHPSGVCIWIGNPDIGLSVKWGAKDNSDYHLIHDEGEKWRLNSKEWKAALAAMNRLPGVANRDVVAVANRIHQMYGSANA